MTSDAPLRILLVEDNRADAVLLQDMLARVQSDLFDMIWEDLLKNALQRLEVEEFDAVLLDLNLPDSHGLATLDAVHSAKMTTPIVVVTGAEDETLALQAIRQGAQDYLVKGMLSARGIVRVIQYAVDRRRVEENLREAQRREMEAEAAATAARTARDTIHAMSEGVLIIDMKGRVLSVNPAMERITGISASGAMGRRINDFFPYLLEQESQAELAQALQTAMEGRLPDMKPLTLRSVSGVETAVIPSAAFIRGTDGKAVSVVVTLRDITDLKRAQDAMKASEKKYRELVECANSIIMRMRSDGTITFVNEFAQRFFGYSQEELVGRNVVGTMVPAGEAPLSRLIAEIGLHPEAYASNENENIRKDGHRVWVQWTNRALRNDAGVVEEILCVGIDATARKKAEEANLRYQQRLRSLANRLASSEEEERRRISRYIHDTVIQSLALANIKMGAFRQAIETSVPQDDLKKLETSRDLIKEGITECRRLMSDLAPAMLYELGLEQALDDLCEKLNNQHEVAIRLDAKTPLPPMEVPLRGLLFQSTRELIVNALKHSGASTIRVTLDGNGTHIRIAVVDNGTGFYLTGARVSRPNGEGGFGLFNLKERVEGLGGRFEISSEPGQGTTAVITAPLAPALPDAPDESKKGTIAPAVPADTPVCT
jgi:PAS domain S-box-containing protein